MRSKELNIYFLCGKDSQKAANLDKDDRVSVTIDHDTAQVMEIAGLSMAARAHRVTDPQEGEAVMSMLMQKYPQQKTPMPIKMPKPEDVAIFRLVPEVVSVLDYTEGFGHTELRDLRVGRSHISIELQPPHGDSCDGWRTWPSRAGRSAHSVERAAKPEEIAEAVLWLLSERASCVTGTRSEGGRRTLRTPGKAEATAVRSRRAFWYGRSPPTSLAT